MTDENAYSKTLESIAKDIAESHFFYEDVGKGLKPQAPSKTAVQIAERIAGECWKLGHSSKEMRTFCALRQQDGIAGKEALDLLRKEFDTLLTNHPHRHIAQYAKLWDRIEELGREMTLAPARLAEEAFQDLRHEIIGKGLQDNIKIVEKFRNPITVVAIAGVAGVVGAVTYRHSLKQKSLEQGTELTHIDRLMEERSTDKPQQDVRKT